MPTYYAWTEIQSDTPADAGDTVTNGGLGISSDEFAELVAIGSVREDAYPTLASAFDTPAEVLAEEDGLTTEVAEAVALLEDVGYTVTPPEG